MSAPAPVVAGLTSLEPIERGCIFVRGMMGMCRPIDAHDIRFDVYPYAQFDAAVAVSFRQHRCRKRRKLILTSLPFLVVLDTDAKTAAGLRADPFGPSTPIAGGSVSVSRHRSCSDAWVQEFDAAVAAAGVRVLRDFRTWNAHDCLRPAQ